ncbi:MAG: thiamine pyrophosphate-dependent enzyme [Bacillota bacterium]
MMHPLGEKYLRKHTLPTIFCPGCGDGTVLSAFLRAVDELDIGEQLALVGGIGCSGWIPVYVNADTLHVLHGRAIPFATGLKVTRPERKVVVFTGDGDCLAIGGNHFIHACRRNIGMTVVMLNNAIYGMTGGQVAPTSPYQARTQTSPYGNPEMPFDACRLAIASGATYVARWTSGHPRQLTRAFKEAILHPGFAFIEVLTQCPTQTGRYMKGGLDAPALLKDIRAGVVGKERAASMSPEELAGKVQIGTLHREVRLEFTEALRQLTEGDGK